MAIPTLMWTLMRQPRHWSRMTRNLVVGSIISVLLLAFFAISDRPSTITINQPVECPYNDIAGNVVVAVKTGATEAEERVEVLMQTSLRCAKHVLFFSDLEQDIGPYHLHDTLQDISLSPMDDPIFEFYHRQRELWKTDGNITSLKGVRDPYKPDDLAAWSLDKYKNMHMVEKTWELEPDKDWYVFIDADTYIVWSNLMRWLSSLDSGKRGFFGSKLHLAGSSFMHGGSGMVMSKNTVYDFAVTNSGTAARWDPKIREECCGDFMLSRALVEYGNDLSNVWPSISGQKPCTFPYSLSKSYWCEPTVTMHHLTPLEMRRFTKFERLRKNPNTPITSEEIFESLVKESLLHVLSLDGPLEDWDNMSWKHEIGANLSGGDDETIHTESVSECAIACEDNPSCVQYTHDGENCFLGKATRLGERKEPADGKRWHSGWHKARVSVWLSKQKACKSRGKFPASLDSGW